MLFCALHLTVDAAQQAHVLAALGLVAHQHVVVERKEAKLRMRSLIKRPRTNASTILIRREFLTVLCSGTNLHVNVEVTRRKKKKMEKLIIFFIVRLRENSLTNLWMPNVKNARIGCSDDFNVRPHILAIQHHILTTPSKSIREDKRRAKSN